MRKTLRLAAWSRERHRLTYTAEIAGRAFTSTFRYESADFDELERRFGGELLRAICFHAIAFDLNRLLSLRPDKLDFGPFADLVTEEFLALWQQIYEGVWAQWRYENDLPGYRGPELAHPVAESRSDPASIHLDHPGSRSLLFCGGGKDSLLCAKLLEEIGEPFDSLAHSHSIYGDGGFQHELIDGLLDHCAPQRRHRLWIEDDFLGVVEPREFGVESITAAETPSGLFLSLPIALAHGFECLIVGHEKSADSGNLVWDETGEEINHQWAKSLEAEALLDKYVGRLVPGLRYFSLIKPVHDPVIFAALRDYPEAIPATHSCNERKPWCRRCAKCVYVWLGYASWLPPGLVLETFGENLFEAEENLGWFAQLLGLEEHLPFECVGQVEESRLALELAAGRGWSGVAIRRFAPRLQQQSGTPEASLFEIADGEHRIPEALAGAVLGSLRSRSSATRELVTSTKKEGGLKPSLTR
jgi:hypothetical protein